MMCFYMCVWMQESLRESLQLDREPEREPDRAQLESLRAKVTLRWSLITTLVSCVGVSSSHPADGGRQCG